MVDLLKGDRFVLQTGAVVFCFWQILFALIYVSVCGSAYSCQGLTHTIYVYIHILYVLVHNFVLM